MLKEIVDEVVRHHELQREPPLELGPLEGRAAAEALLDVFVREGALIVAAGGRMTRRKLELEIASRFESHWDLAHGPALVAARQAIDVWDQSGIFVARKADEIVAPRVRLFAEVADALAAVDGLDDGWVRESAADRERHESLLLATGLSRQVAEQVVVLAASGSDELAFLALRALREGAKVDDEHKRILFDRILALLAPTRESWEAWQDLLQLSFPSDLRPRLRDALKVFTREHEAIGRALAALEWNGGSVGENDLREVLRIENPPRLPSHAEDEGGLAFALVDKGYSDAIVGAAERLLPTEKEVAALVVTLIEGGHISSGVHDRLHELLIATGHAEVSRDLVNKEARRVLESLGGLLLDPTFDDDLPDLLDRMATLAPPARLGLEQSRRLSELADLCQTLNLNSLAAWPQGQKPREERWRLLEVVVEMAELSPGVISEQARIMRCLVDTFGNEPFFGLFDNAEVLRLSGWDNVDTTKTLDLLTSVFFHGEQTAVVAARALAYCPDHEHVDAAVESALPRMPYRNRRWAVLASVATAPDEESRARELSTYADPLVRASAVEGLPLVAHNGGPTSDLERLALDRDGSVRGASVKTYRPRPSVFLWSRPRYGTSAYRHARPRVKEVQLPRIDNELKLIVCAWDRFGLEPSNDDCSGVLASLRDVWGHLTLLQSGPRGHRDVNQSLCTKRFDKRDPSAKASGFAELAISPIPKALRTDSNNHSLTGVRTEFARLRENFGSKRYTVVS